jgi:hypothetical protein
MVNMVFPVSWLESIMEGERPTESPSVYVWPNKQKLTASLLLLEDRKIIMNALASKCLAIKQLRDGMSRSTTKN